jgi:phage antirepressor YoqD-like protein
LTPRLLTSVAAMAQRVDQLPVTIERLERALVLLAYFIEVDGDVHLPMYEKFETELAELKTKEATRYRARRRLESYLNEGGGLKAIR